ncbi:MAG: hypothetical protein DMG39_24230 [Acidobacteria bacterium]|nr:MAG: hypothetical protein DMG39_24230 [Acidobacteriota bacterium]
MSGRLTGCTRNRLAPGCQFLLKKAEGPLGEYGTGGGTPDCEWGFPMPDLGEIAVKECYASFRKHCVEAHGLKDDDLWDSQMFPDLGKWTLTLLTRECSPGLDSQRCVTA